MEANHVREGLKIMLNSGQPPYVNGIDVANVAAKPLVFTVDNALNVQYLNDQLINGPLRIFVGAVTVCLHQFIGGNGVMLFYDAFGNINCQIEELKNPPNVNAFPRHFTMNLIFARLEVSNTWATKYGLHFSGYTFEYKPRP
jgi:hypothetical protein